MIVPRLSLKLPLWGLIGQRRMLPETFPPALIRAGAPVLLVEPCRDHICRPVCPTVWHAGVVNDASWAALMISLTIVCAFGTVRAYRRRGLASGLRGLAITLLPAAAWLTGTLQMFTEIAGSVGDWASGLVFNPLVWTGVGLFGASAGLFVISGRMRTKALEGGQGAVSSSSTGKTLPATGASTPTGRAAPPVDDDMADIEEMLRKRGIN